MHFCSTGIPSRDCKAIYDDGYTQTGLYRIKPHNEEFTAYCDMSLNGGGWTVIQRRVNESVDFDRKWKDYQDGFGHYLGNFWLGLEHIRALTQEGNMQLWIGLESFEKHDAANPIWKPEQTWAHVRYEKFVIGDVSSNYLLTISGFDSQDSTIQNSLSAHVGQKFSTKGVDHDNHLHGSCAVDHKGGWWYNDCHDAYLNGIYYKTKTVPAGKYDGISWKSWYGNSISLKTVIMAVKPV